ncbi:MFS quinate transporter [Aspergillus arachidicola]|uniref:MFS quinate transporter n=1 Tax=Aspergillus arachidicola TaxID=656916 RepID=A0A2G7FJ75_9EURO|nr:MFS quinate transporter [Aspergillus arachidicola]
MRSYAQIPQWDNTESATVQPELLSRQGVFRIYWLTAIVCCGGILFGYDSGVIGGVLTFDSFLRDFNCTPDVQTRVSAIAVGIQQAGALVGCLAIWPVTNRHGRRWAMMYCSAIFCLGVILEVINSHSLPVFYLGRVICGLGIGGSATVIPIYLSEMSPTDMRARLGSCYQFMFTVGILVSYWVDYGIQFRAPTAAQWQIPLALQLVPGALMGLGMLNLDESVRWLLSQGDSHRAWTSLTWIRASSGPSVAAEFAQIKEGIEADRHATADFHVRELLERPNARRFLLGISLFLAQQSTGATAMAYFGPQFFSLLVGGSGTNQSLTLLLTGIFGALKVISCLAFIIWVAERFGRRPLLILGALAMSLCMASTAFVVRSDPSTTPTQTTSHSIKSTGILTISLIYLDIIAYNFSWGPLPWPCTAELFNTRIREPGVAAGVAAQWLGNFVWSASTPYILAGMGWATFLLFGVLDLAIAGFVWGCLPETGGRSLEEVEALFEQTVPDEEGEACLGKSNDGCSISSSSSRHRDREGGERYGSIEE